MAHVRDPCEATNDVSRRSRSRGASRGRADQGHLQVQPRGGRNGRAAALLRGRRPRHLTRTRTLQRAGAPATQRSCARDRGQARPSGDDNGRLSRPELPFDSLPTLERRASRFAIVRTPQHQTAPEQECPHVTSIIARAKGIGRNGVRPRHLRQRATVPLRSLVLDEGGPRPPPRVDRASDASL